jgi:CubicO group peptidase (beta-lactamase class C family)
MEKFEKIFNEYAKTAYEGVVYGMKDGEKFNAQYGNDLDKKFPIGGVTKLFTITCVLKLIENKKLILDTKLPVYLSEEECKNLCVLKGLDHSKVITIRDLIYQTSGLSDYFNEFVKPHISKSDMKYTFSDKINWTKKLGGMDKPAKQAYYSNLNTDLLTYIIEKSTGKTIMEVYKENIFEPLGLKNTYIPMNDSDYVPALFFDGKPLKRPNLLRSCYGSGGLISTARELMKFLVAFFSGKLFNISLFEKIMNFIPMANGLDSASYGGGLMRIKSKKVIIGQLGYTGAFAFADPNAKVYYVGYLSQVDCQQINAKMIVELFEKA